MTFYFIKENSRMWKTQRYKSYGMTIDTNSYEKTKDTNCYEISRGFWFTTSKFQHMREREREREYKFTLHTTRYQLWNMKSQLILNEMWECWLIGIQFHITKVLGSYFSNVGISFDKTHFTYSWVVLSGF